MIQKQLEAIPVPIVKKFSDIVDQMIFDFKAQKKIDIFIQKLSPNNYLFGTKKIYAKVVNERLLIRVGGGFMDIDAFYLNYGQDEYVKWQRLQEKQRQPVTSEQEPASVKNSRTSLTKRQATLKPAVSPKQSTYNSSKQHEQRRQSEFGGQDFQASTEYSTYLTDQSKS